MNGGGGGAAPILEVRDLDGRFHGGQGIVHAVRDVGFTVAPGEIVALVIDSGRSCMVASMVFLTPRSGNA